IEDSIFLRFAFDNLTFMTFRANYTYFLNSRLSISTIWQTTAGIEFTITTKFNDHWSPTDFIINSCWLIFYLSLIHLYLSIVNFLRERLIEFVYNSNPFFFSFFNII